LMNDPFVMDQAQHLANAVCTADSSSSQRIVEIYQRLFNRIPSAPEQIAAIEFLEEFDSATSESAIQYAGWGALCQSLLASSEFLYVE